MNDWFGEVVAAARAPSYVCCPLEPVIGDTSFLVGERPEVAENTSLAPHPTADNDGIGMAVGPSQHRQLFQISVCSEISRASSTSMPRYLTVDSSLVCPRSN